MTTAASRTPRAPWPRPQRGLSLNFAPRPEASMNVVSVAVIGAGLAGLACARRLAEAGVHARVFEAQRAPGGRLATRRFALASFDHGAQYLTATDAGVDRVLQAAAAGGAWNVWHSDV